ncbi:MAG: hypothetical protein ACAI35_17170 [Candidatus Methylacidiphilales bacterium]|nr:hypothetical protein [Candidatus Methylacidiphilales bacterium]
MNDNDKDQPVAGSAAAEVSAAAPAPASVSAPASVRQVSRTLAPSVLMLAAGILLYGLIGGLVLRISGMTDITDYAPGIYYYLYALMEPLVMIGLMALCVLFAIFIDNKTRVPEVWPQRADSPAWRRLVYGLLPLLVLGVSVAGTFSVMHNYAFGPDEHLVEFQAKALTKGHVAVPLPKDLIWLDKGIKPSFVTTYALGEQAWWVPAYLSGYALIRSGFLLLGAPWLLGPLCSAGSVVLVALIARQIWKDEKNDAGAERAFSETELLAAAMLAVSSQVLLMGMTAFSAPAHLFFNLLWLWLFLRNTPISLVLAGGVGLIAILLQQPMLHVLFALPFVLRLLWQRRWLPAAGFAIFYGVALWFAGFYLGRLLLPPGVAEDMLYNPTPVVTEDKDLYSLYLRTLSLPLFFAWQSLPVLVLGIVAVWHWRKLPPSVRDLAIGFVLVFGLYLVTRGNMGHGWGHRYCHAVLGNIVLLAVAGWPCFAASAGRARAGLFLALSLAVALAVQLPYRAWCAEAVVRPFALSSESLQLHQERFILLDARYKWYGDDLIRNGPFFDTPNPIVIRTQTLKSMNPDNLGVVLDELKRYGNMKLVKSEDLTPYGIPTLSESAMRARGFLNKDGSAVEDSASARPKPQPPLPANRAN